MEMMGALSVAPVILPEVSAYNTAEPSDQGRDLGANQTQKPNNCGLTTLTA